MLFSDKGRRRGGGVTDSYCFSFFLSFIVGEYPRQNGKNYPLEIIPAKMAEK